PSTPGTALRYSPAILRAFNPCVNGDCKHNFSAFAATPKRKRKRGRRGGVIERLKKRKFRPFLPSIVFGNCQSLNNKLEELQANTKWCKTYGEASVICVTETWFNEGTTADGTTIDGFSIFRGDRKGEGCKTRGGGVCLYVNHRWANPNNSHIKLTACSPNLDILTVHVRPFYLPIEFSSNVFNVVFIPLNANDSDVTEQLVSIVQEQEDRWPDAAVYVLGDFNHVMLRDHLPHFSQHVTVPTRKEKTIDLCYSNTPDSHKSYQLPCLGDSDHNMVHICPKYRPTLKTESTTTKTVQKWNAEQKTL
ncbi:hypothetical protein ElyMa_006632800, partial [Elysia marginata]